MSYQLPPYFRSSEPSEVRALELPYHLADTKMPDHWMQTDGGAGITVGICDTGIDATHPEFVGKTVTGESFVPVRRRRQAAQWNVDENDHGTHVAGIIAGNTVGVAPNADLVIAQVLDANGSGFNSAIAEGIHYCREQGVDLINLSLGGPTDDQETADAIAQAQASGILVIIATGNEQASHVSFPAVHGIGIGAVDRGMKLAYFSNRGKNVDLVGYGVDVYSSVPDGKYQKFSGTSMATPFIVGCFANRQSLELKQTGSIVTRTPDDALKLETLVIDLGPEGKDTSYGRGFPDLDRGLVIDGSSPKNDELTLLLSLNRRTYGPTILTPNKD